MNHKYVVVSACSGAGKTTLVKMLLNDIEKLYFSISATTRPPRANEKDGKDYHFLSRDEFENAIKNNELIEWERLFDTKDGDYYGTLKKNVSSILEKGYIPLFDIDVKGGLNLKKIYGEKCLSVFVDVKSTHILADRLKKRGMSNDSIEYRIRRVQGELKYKKHYDCIIMNDNLDNAFLLLKTLVMNFIKL